MRDTDEINHLKVMTLEDHEGGILDLATMILIHVTLGVWPMQSKNLKGCQKYSKMKWLMMNLENMC